VPTLLEQLVDDLDSDLANRRREIVDIRLMVSASSGARLDLLARACHVMAYAHWEGFVKRALRAYLDYLLTRGLNVGDLQLGLQGLALREAIKVAVEPDRAVDRIANLLQQFDSRAAEPFRVAPQEVVKTGNMTASTLRALLGCVGLDYLPAYQTRENYIDSVVCGRRHRIAHGDWQPISGEEAREVSLAVLDLCSEINLQIQEAALYQSFLLPASP
jgi:hypothetical protein